MQEKPVHPPPYNLTKRRSSLKNGTIIRSKSFDNIKHSNSIGQRKILSKSKTLGSIAHCPKKKRSMENGSAECLHERQRENKRRRLFRQTSIDHSPLWTTLTHARTISDFSIESWSSLLHSSWNYTFKVLTVIHSPWASFNLAFCALETHSTTEQNQSEHKLFLMLLRFFELKVRLNG